MTILHEKPQSVSSYDWETGATTYDVTQMDAATRFRCAISQATEAARRRFPHSTERIERAYEIVHAGKVVLHPASGTATVQASGDRKDGPTAYTVNGVCNCPDSRAPESYCKHRLAVVILRKAVLLLGEWKQATAPVTVVAAPLDTEAVEAVTEPVTEPVVQEPGPVLEAEVIPTVPSVPREFLYERDGTTAIRWGGLLHMAHQAGLCTMQVEVVTVTADLAVMRATATFNDGGVWSDIGDASPGNVGARVAPHFIRMASTRALARCLRLALDIQYVCAVELSDD